MMFDTITGLPIHPLVVHATEVIVPTAALVVVLAALWPAFRRWARFLPFGLALVALVLVPISSQSGEALQERVKETSLIQTHADMAEGLAPWSFVLFVVAALLLWWNWNEREAPAPRAPRWVALALAVTAFLAAAGTMVQAVRIGHSGATATWSQVAGGAIQPPSAEAETD
jgi:glucan phosphoethanolaminetransferase (alkaline phosphatase superfamily)